MTIRLACFAVACLWAGAAWGQKGEPGRIASQYKTINDAYRMRRFERLNEVIVPNAVIVAKNGRRTAFRTAIPRMAKGWSNVVEGSIAEAPVRISVSGTKGTAYVVQRGQTVERVGKRLVTMKGYGRVIDTWVRTPKGWKLKESRSVTGLMMVPVWVDAR